MDFHVIKPEEILEFRRLRIEALTNAPQSVMGQPGEAEKPLIFHMGMLTNNIIMGAYNDDEKLIGMVGATILNSHRLSHKALLWGAYLDKEARGHGDGRALTIATIDHLHMHRGVKHFLIATLAVNHSVIEMCKSIGFIETHTEPNGIRDAFSNEFHDLVHLIKYV